MPRSSATILADADDVASISSRIVIEPLKVTDLTERDQPVDVLAFERLSCRLAIRGRRLRLAVREPFDVEKIVKLFQHLPQVDRLHQKVVVKPLRVQGAPVFRCNCGQHHDGRPLPRDVL